LLHKTFNKISRGKLRLRNVDIMSLADCQQLFPIICVCRVKRRVKSDMMFTPASTAHCRKRDQKLIATRCSANDGEIIDEWKL